MGSVGTRAWIALMLGRDGRDPLFLQVKEAQPSVLEEFAGRSVYRNAGHRVVAGQRLMQAASDLFLGWLHVADSPDAGERDFYVRQLRDWKGSAEIEAMVPKGMRIYAEMCGWTLARAHARSGDPVAIAAYLGNKRRLRPGHRGVRGGLRRPQRARLRAPQGGRGERAARGRDGAVAGDVSRSEPDPTVARDAPPRTGSAMRRRPPLVGRQGDGVTCEPVSGAPPASAAPLELDLKLRLILADLDLDLEPDLVGDMEAHVLVTPLELDVVMGGQVVSEGAQACRRLLARDCLLALDLQDVHLALLWVGFLSRSGSAYVRAPR